MWVLGVYADHAAVRRCCVQVVQNSAQAGKHAVWIPRWPQPAVSRVCDELGLTLLERDGDGWNDYSDVGAVIALRAFGRSKFKTKPPSRLINAWQSGAIFIGGADSALRQIGTPGEDYLAVESEAGLRNAVEQLKKRCCAASQAACPGTAKRPDV